MFSGKLPYADVRRSYVLHLEIGFIVALGILALLFRAEIRSGNGVDFGVIDNPPIMITQIPLTEQKQTPPAPPKPVVLATVPNDGPEDDTIPVSEGIDTGSPLTLPPAPEASTETPDDIYTLVPERNPELIGGLANLQRSIVYPEIARKAGIEGRVFVEFIVDEHGRVLNPRVVRGIGGGCDEAALAAVQKAKFKPGMQRGRPVKVKYSLPIVFKLQS
jgi:protein TonB